MRQDLKRAIQVFFLLALTVVVSIETIYAQEKDKKSKQNPKPSSVSSAEAKVVKNEEPKTTILDANARDAFGRTALMLASEKGDAQVVKALLNKGAEVNAKTEAGWTALMFAAYRGHADTVQILLASGANVGMRENIYEFTAWRLAAGKAHTSVTTLLSKAGAKQESFVQVSEYTTDLNLMLLGSVEKGFTTTVRSLLAEGADPNGSRTFQRNMTPLMVAALQGNAVAVDALLQAGANIHATDNNGQVALVWAAAGGHHSIIKTLLAKGADVNAKSKNKSTPLIFASILGRADIVETLLDAGADINAKNEEGKTALMIATSEKHIRVIQILEARISSAGQTGSILTVQKEQQPKTAEEYFNRGFAYHQKGDLDPAIQDYSQAISLDPKLAKAYNERGYLYYKKGDLDRAIQDYNQAISFDPKLARAYINRGAVYYGRGDFDRAIQDYNQIISLNPKDTNAVGLRGLAYYKKGDFDRAIQDYNQIISLNPKPAELTVTYQMRAKAYRALGKNDLADADEKKAQELSGKKP